MSRLEMIVMGSALFVCLLCGWILNRRKAQEALDMARRNEQWIYGIQSKVHDHRMKCLKGEGSTLSHLMKLTDIQKKNGEILDRIAGGIEPKTDKVDGV